MTNYLTEKSLAWQALRPELNLTSLPAIMHKSCDFFALQPRACTAICHFLKNTDRTLLLLKADEATLQGQLLAEFITSQFPTQNVISGVHYEVIQGDSFSFPSVLIRAAQSKEDNFAAKKSVTYANYFDQFQLFGAVRVHPHSKDIQLYSGLVHQLNGGVLILNVAALLTQLELWRRLKHILLTQQFDWYASSWKQNLPCDIPSYPLSLKVILLGNRDELAMLAEMEADLYAWADYSELENYYGLNNEEQQQNWAVYIQTLAQQQGVSLDLSGVNRLYQLLVRETEQHQLVSLSATKIKLLLKDTALFAKGELLSAVDFEHFYQQQQQQRSYLKQQAYADILNEQVYVATDGEVVGQINALSLIEYQGTPLAFGEPTRLSCLVQFGEGEIIDIDRKNELAGNIHSKGMMIAQACLANILALPSQLPFSASLVFEQSYTEIDGDSASLACFGVLVSALAELPLPQSFALTGTIDQFGLVHSVGGVNEKIEGFFAICHKRGLTGKQGVIIPSVCANQLSLNEEVISAVKNGEFFIFPVDDVYQACEILFQRDLVEEENQLYLEHNQPITRLINSRIERFEQNQHKKPCLLDWFRKK